MTLLNSLHLVLPPTTVLAKRNPNFDSFIQSMRDLAMHKGIEWSIALDDRGVALKGEAWDLRRIVNDGRPKTAVLRTFSLFPEALEAMAIRNPDAVIRAGGPVSIEWQNFIKATVLEYLIVRKKTIPFVSSLALAIRFLAAVSDKSPWKVTAEDVQLTCELADKRQPSKGTSIILQAMVTTVVDRLHLFDTCPLMGLVKRSKNGGERRSKFFLAQDALAKNLAERKAEKKLPEQRAFWELVRIVFTEKPETLNDALRFAMVKVLIFTGLRVGEVALLPLDWKRTRTYLDSKGEPAGDSGGYSESLMLRHFAEKQGTTDLYETTQFVPEIFSEELERTLTQVAMITAPLRSTLKTQYESDRLFPMYKPDTLVDAIEMYVRLTGNPLWGKETRVEVAACIEQYQETWSPDALRDIQDLQRGITDLAARVSRFFSPENRAKGLVLRDKDGTPNIGRGVKGKFLRVSDVEAYVREHVPTKMPDLKDFRLDKWRHGRCSSCCPSALLAPVVARACLIQI